MWKGLREFLRGPVSNDPPTPTEDTTAPVIVQQRAPPGPESLDYVPKYPYGSKSKAVQMSLSPNLILLTNKLADLYDISLVSGFRDEFEQDEYYRRGTGLKWPTSYHNVFPSKAVDFQPYPLDWTSLDDDDINQFHLIIGAAYAIAKEHNFTITSGKYFSNIRDLPHIQEES